MKDEGKRNAVLPPSSFFLLPFFYGFITVMLVPLLLPSGS